MVLKEGAAALVGAAKNRPVASVGWAVVGWTATTVVSLVGPREEVVMVAGGTVVGWAATTVVSLVGPGEEVVMVAGGTVAVVVETAVVKMVKQREREAVELEVEEEEVVTDAQYEPRSQCNRRQSHNQNTTNAAHRHRTRHHC